MTSGGSGAWRSRGRRDAMPKPSEPDLAGRRVDEHIGRLDVLVDQAPPVELAQRDREANGDAQELRSTPAGYPAAASSGSPPGSVEDEHRPPLVRGEGERPDGPPGVKLGP